MSLKNFAEKFGAARGAAGACHARVRAFWRRLKVAWAHRRRAPRASFAREHGFERRFDVRDPGDAFVIRSGLAGTSYLLDRYHARFTHDDAGPRCLRCCSRLWTDHAAGDVLRCLLCDMSEPRPLTIDDWQLRELERRLRANESMMWGRPIVPEGRA